jgi:hypothetical protein
MRAGVLSAFVHIFQKVGMCQSKSAKKLTHAWMYVTSPKDES